MHEALEELNLKSQRENVARDMPAVDTSLFVSQLIVVPDQGVSYELIVMALIDLWLKNFDVLVNELLLSQIAEYPACREVQVLYVAQSVGLTADVDQRRSVLLVKTDAPSH